MSKTRMNEGLRDVLKALAVKVITCPKEQAAEEKAYAKAAPLVLATVQKKYPPRDMRVLAKYDKASHDDCIKLQLGAGGVEQFDFRKEKGPIVAYKTYSSPIYAADSKTTDAVSEWCAARDALKAAQKSKQDDYAALIMSATHLDDIIEVWPEAEQFRPKQGRALIPMSPDVLKRIRADVALRKFSKS